MYLIFIHLVGAAGGILAKCRKIPAGAMIGALVLAVLCNTAIGREVSYPVALRVLVQISSGLVIGSRFSRNDVRELRVVFKPLILLVAILFALNLFFAFLVSRLSSVNFLTALFSCAPGGVSDLALVAVDFGVNVDQVTVLQLVRFVFVVSFFPLFMKRRFCARRDLPQLNLPRAEQTLSLEPERPETPVLQKERQPLRTALGRTALSVLAAAAGGLLFRQLGVPAGAIIGAIVAIILLMVTTGKTLVPPWLRTGTQVFAGVYIGLQVTKGTLVSLGALLAPMLLVLAETLAMAFLASFLISRMTKLDETTSLFSSIPGGIAEMGLIADEMGLDTPKIVAMHTGRLISVICFMPILIHFFIK